MNREASLARKTFPNTLATRLGADCAARLLPLLLLFTLPTVVEAQFTYTTNNGTITINRYTGPGGAVSIPSTINGLPVTSIGAKAFFQCFGLDNVTIPDSVTGIGDGAFGDCGQLTSVAIGTNVTSIGDMAFQLCSLTSLAIPNSVTSIGNSAFYNCSVLTSVTIPRGVTSIGDLAFYYCTSLTAITVDTNNPAYSSAGGVLFDKGQTTLIQCPEGKAGSYTIPNSVTSIRSWALSDCFRLTRVTIGDNVNDIGDYAFNDCYSLTSVTMGNSVTSIGGYAFNSCYNLTNITIPHSVTTIGDSAFYTCWVLPSITIPDSVTSIGISAFGNCHSLTNVVIPKSVTIIEDNTFAACASLISVTIPNSVTRIGVAAFSGCASLTSVTIPDSVTSIGQAAFQFCNSLTSVTIGNGVTSIGNSAFYNCSVLTSVTIPRGVTSIGDLAFYYCTSLTAITVDTNNPAYSSADGVLFNKSQTTLVQYPEGKPDSSYTIPNSVTSIGSWAFSCCSNLASVVIPNSVTSIGERAFFDCYYLTSVTIPNSVTGIGANAFAVCASLISVTIPNCVTSIADVAFNGCISLTSVTIGDGVTSIGIGAFDGCTSLISVTIGDGVRRIADAAFSGCTNLSGVFFQGNAPRIGASAFDPVSATVYYLAGTTNWASTFGGLPTALWNPLVPYHYTTNNGAITITGYITGYSNSADPVLIAIPNSINDLPVTSIGSAAFENCTKLTTIAIPNSVTSIKSGAFYDCTSLTSITVDTNNPAYSSAGGVLFDKTQTTLVQYPEGKPESSYTIPNSVTRIGEAAFQLCTSLTRVTMPASVINIGGSAFYDCDSLSSVCFQGNAPGADSQVFGNDSNATIYYLPGTTGWETTFAGRPTFLWDPLSQVAYTTTSGTIAITGYIGPGRSLTIPSTVNGVPVTSIGDNAFSGFTNLATVTIGTNVNSIGSEVFQGCTSLTSVTIGSSVTSIGDNAFWGCDSLTAITVDKGNSVYSDLDGVLFNQSLTMLVHCPGGITGSYTIPNGVATIGDGAFGKCLGLTSVVIPNSVTCIGDNAFSWCTNLTSVYFEGNAPTFGADVFDHVVQLPWSGWFAVWDPATIYYLPGTTGGWSTNFAPLPTALWIPHVQTGDASFGMRTNQFGFTINWASGMTVVVEACTNLANPTWYPLATNTLTRGLSYFSDPQWTNYPVRLYRLRSP